MPSARTPLGRRRVAHELAASVAIRSASSSPRRILAAGGGDVALAAATTADRLGGVLDEVGRFDALRTAAPRRRGSPRRSAWRRSARRPHARLLADGDRQVAQVAGLEPVDAVDDTPSPAAPAISAGPSAAPAARAAAFSSSCSDLISSSLRCTPATTSPVRADQLAELGQRPLVALEQVDGRRRR